MTDGQMALLIPHISILVPLVTIVLTLIAAIVAIVTWNRRKVRELEQRHKERMAAIDKGIDLPMEPLPPSRPSRPVLLRGLIWLGIGLAIVFGGSGDSDLTSLGWIPVAVGTAYLIYYFAEERKRAQAQLSAQAPSPGEKS